MPWPSVTKKSAINGLLIISVYIPSQLNKAGIKLMIIASYECGCTWIGHEHECADMCRNHADNISKIHYIGRTAPVPAGWCFEEKEGRTREVA